MIVRYLLYAGESVTAIPLGEAASQPLAAFRIRAAWKLALPVRHFVRTKVQLDSNLRAGGQVEQRTRAAQSRKYRKLNRSRATRAEFRGFRRR